MTETLRTTSDPIAPIDPQDAQVREMLLTIICSIVDEPEAVELLHILGEDGAAFQVRAATNDIGKLIGKSGRTARAIRTILSGSAARNSRRYSLDIAHHEPTPTS